MGMNMSNFNILKTVTVQTLEEAQELWGKDGVWEDGNRWGFVKVKTNTGERRGHYTLGEILEEVRRDLPGQTIIEFEFRQQEYFYGY